MAFQIDNAHTQIQFAVRHMMISKVRGEFTKFSGSVDLNVERPELTAVDVAVDLASINTRDAQRDGHLRSADFFDVENYPTMKFKSTNVQVLDKKHAKLTGDLTIRDVTKPLTLDVEYVGSAKSPWGATSYGFAAKAKINREDWGLVWNVALETGGWLVGKDVEIEVEVELVQVAETQPEAVAA
jgi:polyisoprenoid-binding protein YceI